jgi:serine/threonine-protein kinase HipA
MKCLVCFRESSANYHGACGKELFGSASVPVNDISMQALKDIAHKNSKDRVVVSGVQPKISLGIEKSKTKSSRLTIMNFLSGSFILKPPHEKYAELPECEALTMELAKINKINVAPHGLYRLQSGELCYLSRRFDRVVVAHRLQKIHQEDFCQLSEQLTEDKYRYSSEKLFDLIDRLSTQAGLDKVNLLQLLLFSFVTGNNDMHLKNFSLVEGEDGVRLSPAYDLVNVNLVNPKDTEECALPIGGKKKNIGYKHFKKLAEKAKIPEKVFQKIVTQLVEQEAAWRECIENSFLSEKSQKKYLNLVRSRLSRLSI